MGLLNWLGWRAPLSPAVGSAFDTIMLKSREPGLYGTLGVPDTLDGRLEMLMMHMFVLLDRLQGADAAANEFGRDVVEMMFSRLDDAMREMGISDQRVPRKMKDVASSFYGRLNAYTQAKGDRVAMAAALARNVTDSNLLASARIEAGEGEIGSTSAAHPAKAPAAGDASPAAGGASTPQIDTERLADYVAYLQTQLAAQALARIIAGEIVFTSGIGSAA